MKFISNQPNSDWLYITQLQILLADWLILNNIKKLRQCHFIFIILSACPQNVISSFNSISVFLYLYLVVHTTLVSILESSDNTGINLYLCCYRWALSLANFEFQLNVMFCMYHHHNESLCQDFLFQLQLGTLPPPVLVSRDFMELCLVKICSQLRTTFIGSRIIHVI